MRQMELTLFLHLCDILVLKTKPRYWEMYIISFLSGISEIVADKWNQLAFIDI